MSGFQADLRSRSLAALRDATIDVLIVGGGINGAGIARDLGMRRLQSGVTLQVGLLDQGHFASGTSGRNSQLIHGGLRYLKYLKFGLVKQSLHERSVLRGLAPHLVEPLAFLMPLYSRMEKMKYLMGLSMYDSLAGDANISKHREVSKAEILETEPEISLKGLVGGALFYDCQVNSARFVLENLFEAAANGVYMANYTRVEPLERQPDGIWRVKLEDTISGEKFETRAKKLVDATGAWSHPEEGAPRLVRGSHLILPRLTAEEHAIAYFDEKGRIVFLIPWGAERELTLLGTTDADHKEGPDKARITKEEVDYLLGVARKLYPKAGQLEPLGAYSSLRPLVADEGASATDVSREHKIFNSKDGILRIQGGKYTVYRIMSQEAVNLIVKEIAPWLMSPSKTEGEALNGNTEKALNRLKSDALRLAEERHMAKVDVDRLIREYGIHTTELLPMMPAEEFGPISRVEYARIAYAIQHEMALRLSDVLYVSTYLGFSRRWDAVQLEPYAYLMGSWLGWDSARQAKEIELALRVTAMPGAR